jgi:MFS family permease
VGVRVLQAGLVVNAFGNGAAAPFLIIYLHNVRSIPLAVAGLASGTAAASALAATLVSGGIADRRGARPSMVGGLACSTLAYGLYPFVVVPWHALALAVLAGAGIGTWLTMQSSLLAALTPADLRHVAFAWQRVAANVGPGLGGFAGGLIVASGRPATFTLLFWLNAATFMIYALVLSRIAVPPTQGRVRPQRGYRPVWADRVFRRLVVFNFVVVAAAVSLLNALLPVFAANQVGIGGAVIGALFLLNATLVVTVQVPAARAVEGGRRMPVLAVMCLLFGGSWLLVGAAGLVRGGVAVAGLALAIGVFSLAECLYDAVYGPLVSDLAPPELLGRYMAVSGFSWQFGFIVGPAAGAVLLSLTPAGTWLIAAAGCVGAAWYALRPDRQLPDRARRTPQAASLSRPVGTVVECL